MMCDVGPKLEMDKINQLIVMRLVDPYPRTVNTMKLKT